ncbi:hypothetical protein [Ruegeria marisrubri]|uniref:hypothetical protein n=1 Tax=Ruegeria marisrubri TaxID=1685379 RepID=UPI0009E7210C|nr:hypothetical protein [Ruegeria marisrubri]
MRRLFLILALGAAPVSADVVGPDGKVRDCYCTDSNGARVELGETICLQVDGRMFMAQCQMSLNVPMWREVSEGCLSSRLQSVQPPLQPLSVDPKI